MYRERSTLDRPSLEDISRHLKIVATCNGHPFSPTLNREIIFHNIPVLIIMKKKWDGRAAGELKLFAEIAAAVADLST